MDLAAQYARALYAAKNPDMSRVREALKRRGHLKLAPRIASEYKKLELAHKRKDTASKSTPEQERTRVLLELYRKLIAQ